MSKKNYRLDKIVDSCRIYAASVTKTTNGLDEKISTFLDSLKKLGNTYSMIEEDSLLCIMKTLACKRAITTEVMLISETRGKYKKISCSEISNFISEQGKSGMLSQCKHCNDFFIVITKDHIFPRSEGGIDHPFNMQDMCYFCNTKKSNFVEKKPFIEVYYHKDCKVLLPVYQANKLGLSLNKNSLKGKVYTDNPHILQLPNLV